MNANAVSLLQRAHAAQVLARTAHGAGTRVRFTLLSNWQVAKTDPLYAMIHTTNGSLRLEGAKGLFHGKTAKSASGKIHRCWCDHLQIDEAALDELVRTLAFVFDDHLLDQHCTNLDQSLARHGMRRVPANETPGCAIMPLSIIKNRQNHELYYPEIAPH